MGSTSACNVQAAGFETMPVARYFRGCDLDAMCSQRTVSFHSPSLAYAGRHRSDRTAGSRGPGVVVAAVVMVVVPPVPPQRHATKTLGSGLGHLPRHTMITMCDRYRFRYRHQYHTGTGTGTGNGHRSVVW